MDELIEVKKGQVGSGLLIEHDGHIIGNTNQVNQIREDIGNGLKFTIPDDFIVSAVFQKYGIKNANGRIYPENILKSAVQKYLENQVAEHRAIGALDHPSCQLADTQILTEEGWKYITDVNVGENILTINENKKIEIKPIIKTINQEYKGKLIHLKGRFIDIKVTPNHKFPVLDVNKKWKGFYTAQDILDNKIPEQSQCYLFKIDETESGKQQDFIIDSLTKLKVTEEDYEGKVYCVEVENHTFYTMCNNGKCLWSGNSSTLSGHDVSHNILDLRWEGHTLVGEMKLHLSPGYKKYGVCSTSGDLVANMILDGIKIGVSSRALGSVENQFGNLVVGDDLEIIGWDTVCEPSTPNAWISRNPEEIKQYVESYQTNKNKNKVYEKLNNLKQYLK